MKNFKKEDGAITIITVVTVFLVASFLISSLMIVSNKVKNQKEMINETREIYEPKSSMKEIYDSFFSNDNIIPIYNVEQLIAIGTGEKINIDGKIYEFKNEQNTTYLLKNDIEFKLSDYKDNDNWIPFMEQKEFKGIFDYNGKKVIMERKDGTRVIYPSVYAKNMEGLGAGVSLIPYSELNDSIRRIVDERKVYAVLKETIDEEDTLAVIPVGFTVSNINGENTISGGLVVSDSLENEFVWIPIQDIDSMALPQEEGSTNYRGVLYDWANDSTGETKYPYSYNGYHVEPGNIRSPIVENNEPTTYAYDSQEAFTRFGGGTWSSTMYQEEFNEMTESVKKCKGFYIGRYETGGFNANTAVSKAGEGEDSINNANWYKMYKMQKEFANGREGIKSSMIWGCQWDQVMKFVNGKIDGVGNTYDVTTASSLRHTDSLAATGSNINDKVQNIYDLEGNVDEWTLEVMMIDYLTRVYRSYTYSAERTHGDGVLSLSTYDRGSRITLYIK